MKTALGEEEGDKINRIVNVGSTPLTHNLACTFIAN